MRLPCKSQYFFCFLYTSQSNILSESACWVLSWPCFRRLYNSIIVLFLNPRCCLSRGVCWRAMEANIGCASKIPQPELVFPLAERRWYSRSVTLKTSEAPKVAGEDGPVSEQNLVTSLVMCLASVLTEKWLSFLEF